MCAKQAIDARDQGLLVAKQSIAVSTAQRESTKAMAQHTLLNSLADKESNHGVLTL